MSDQKADPNPTPRAPCRPPSASNGIDYSRDIALIRRASLAGEVVSGAELVARPAHALAALLGRRRLAKALEGAASLHGWSNNLNRLLELIWKVRYGVEDYHRSPAVAAFSRAGKPIGTIYSHSSIINYREIFGVPIGTSDDRFNKTVYHGPAGPAEIFARARAAGSRWVIDSEGALALDESPVPEAQAEQTSRLISRVQAFDSCRAIVLWGPPRGGKSIAARQIADAFGGGWVRLCGRAAVSGDAWAAVHELAPRAIILDDLDACAGSEDDLLAWLEQARGYARVVVSTMNVLPGQNEGQREHELRGALLAPGRAADEAPVLYRELDQGIREIIAPDVPESLRAPELLASYLAELQARALAFGAVTEGDLEEMRARMRAVGDR